MECTFGILKGRWRILKTGVRLQSKKRIDSVFYTCCVLHNMLMEYDNIHKEWTAGIQYDGLDGLHEVDDMRRIFGRLHVNKTTDLSSVGYQHDNTEIDVHCENDPSFKTLNDALIEHFDVVSCENGIKWPKRKK